MAKAQTSPRAARRRAPEEETPVIRPVEPQASTEDAAPSRLSFPLKADGTIDTERLRSSSREALRKALADPSLANALGMAGTSTSNDDALVMQQIANGLYDGLSALSIALARRAGFSIDQARVLVFTSAEKDVLADPTARVINKYFPDFGGKYRDELMLAFLLTNIMGGKIMMLRASGSTVAPVNPVTPIVEPQEVAQ